MRYYLSIDIVKVDLFVVYPFVRRSFREKLRMVEYSNFEVLDFLRQVMKGLNNLQDRFQIEDIDIQPDSILLASETEYLLSDFDITSFRK